MPTAISTTAQDALKSARRVVIKVGSAILCDQTSGRDGGDVREEWLSSLAADVVEMRDGGCEVVVVTSGAIVLGREKLGLRGNLRLDEKQAASACGQAVLSQAWQAAFSPYGLTIAQILLTLDDTENRRRYLNARATLRTLLDLGAVPLVNENDTIATSEIRYGDNDRLAAHAAQIIGADHLLILSDIDGLYSVDPRHDASATHIPFVASITPEIENAAGGVNVNAGVGSGGMASKISAAKIAGAAGCATIIAPGDIGNPVNEVLQGGPATLFQPSDTRERARTKWIGGRIKSAGTLHIDAGAAKALSGGASLLPAGVTAVTGSFDRGDVVDIIDADGKPICRGLTAYDSGEIEKIAGRKSDEIETILGYRRRPAVVEKDDMAIREDR